MDWIERRKNHLQWSIKFTRKALLSQFGLLLFNIAGISWSIYWYRHVTATNLFFGMSIGVFSSNALWTLGFIFKFLGEIKEEKNELKYIREIELRDALDNDRKMYQESKTQYENMCRQYKEILDAGLQKSNGKNAYTTGQCDLNLQPASKNTS